MWDVGVGVAGLVENGGGMGRGGQADGKLWRLMAQSSIMANKESGKNIVFDNQTENVHSLSQNNERGNRIERATKGAESVGKIDEGQDF